MKDSRNIKLAIIGSNSSHSLELKDKLDALYDAVQPECADVIVVIGGDGFMLHTIHQYLHLNLPFYGINTGSVGFLMNDLGVECSNIPQTIQNSIAATIRPLDIEAENVEGVKFHLRAINEVALFRKTSQACKISIKVNGLTRIPQLIADGVIVATAAGSSAYNFSAGGTIVPIHSRLLCITPISPFRPRKWHGALLPFSASIECDILEERERVGNISADFQEIQDVKKFVVQESKTDVINILFNTTHSLEEKVMREQFIYF
ncbi:NAD kinase [Rickettsiales endosymbiont of Paramecium tredecaurelia]|uniref:NAD kinase n=1 Tax=Candidatus Sarmatiella mevalonica TaxID=2770581 RepID=UPI0019245715|nr:NAD kinase [Candidatus Sarmatiella mevalonica]MBL3284304.1 NAD kinase [Candidatus Sarmatiella mevalonica]